MTLFILVTQSLSQQLWVAFAPRELAILQVVSKSKDSGISSFKILRDAVTSLPHSVLLIYLSDPSTFLNLHSPS